MISDQEILLVEDDPNLGFVIKDNLQAAGFAVTWCEDGEIALSRFRLKNYNICIVDVMLPKLDGFSLLKEIRNINENTPVLLLTAKSMDEDRIHGFEVGADDYITKPFNIEELILRVKVFLKRSQIAYEPKTAQHIITIGAFTLDYPNYKLINGETEHRLTQREADLLLLFAENPNTLLKREQILKAVWGQNDYFLGRSLDVFISRLRKYLKPDPAISITNYHKIGFKFTIDS